MKISCITKNVQLLLLVGFMFSFGNLYAQDDLQEHINKISSVTRASDDITDVDLSQFQATDRKATLDVANGKKFRFINGTLTRSSSLDGPIIHVGGGSYVEISTGATITARGSKSNKETILMDGGELVVNSTGVIEGSGYYDYTVDSYPTAVSIKTDNDKFTINGYMAGQLLPTIDGPIVCEASKASITYKNGYIFYGSHNTGAVIVSASDVTLEAYPLNLFNITLTEKDNIVNLTNVDPPTLKIFAPKKTNEDVVAKSNRSWVATESWWDDKIIWGGDAKYLLYGKSQDNTIRLYYDDLSPFIDDNYPYNPEPWQPCGCNWEQPISIDVPCKGTKTTKDLDFPDDDLYWAINGRPEGYEEEADCEGQVDQGENDVHVRPKAKVRFQWVRWRGCGCSNKHLWIWGTVHFKKHVWFTRYWRFIHIKPGGKAIVDDLYGDCDESVIHLEGGDAEYNGGDSKGGKYGWYCPGGIIYVRGGKLSGGTAGGWTGQSGKSYHYGGTIHGGIHNYGYHYFYGGYCTGGDSYSIYNYKGGRLYYYGGSCSENGKIWNEGDMYIDGGGSIDCGDIYCVRGCRIYIIKKLTFDIKLIFDEKNIVTNEPIILGDEGYKLTEDDCKRIKISLPEGYDWKFDSASGRIVISSTNAISSVNSEPSSKRSYNLSGHQINESHKGLTIQRMSNGKTKKTIVK